MGRSLGTTVENNFIKGVVTEFSGLNFPENSCQEAWNCIFTDKGSVVRRPGIDFEQGYTTHAVPKAYSGVRKANKSFLWASAGGRNENSIAVVQNGDYLHFYRIVDNRVSLFKFPYTFWLGNYATGTGNPLDEMHCQFTTGNGRLFVVGPWIEPFIIDFDVDTEAFSTEKISVRTRDFSILPDIYGPGDAPNTYVNTHQYNVMNQGWTAIHVINFQSVNGNFYPPKSQLPWYYRDAEERLIFEPRPQSRGTQLPGNSLAPRGHFILDEFFQDRVAASGFYAVGIPIVTSQGRRPGTACFMAGRLFLSGVNSTGYIGKIYFSKIMRDSTSDPVFYQENDPTSEVVADLLPNDGGVITIPDSGNIVYLHQVKNALLVFATNGIWAIQGSEGVGFTATDFSVEKISSIPCQSHLSITSVENVPIFWNSDGIYIVEGSSTGGLSVKDVTKETIQSFYDKIPAESKRFAKGAYNYLTKEVYWLYSDNPQDPTDYTKILVLRANTQAFYPFSISPSQCKLKDVFSISGFFSTVTEEDVTASGVDVSANGQPVTISTYSSTSSNSSFKFLTLFSINGGDFDTMSFSDFIVNPIADWNSISPVKFSSYFISGYRLRGEGHRKFQTHYVSVFSKYIADSSCFLSAVWDYANTPNTGRITSYQQAVKNDPTRDYNARKLMIRGNGVSVQYKFESEGTKPFEIIGWSTVESVNERI